MRKQSVPAVTKRVSSFFSKTDEEELANKIDSLEPIEAFSEYEVEIRANTLWVIEIMKEKLKNKGIEVNSIMLDHILWNNLKGTKGTNHHTDTIYY